jgi:hypothetical protein
MMWWCSSGGAGGQTLSGLVEELGWKWDYKWIEKELSY